MKKFITFLSLMVMLACKPNTNNSNTIDSNNLDGSEKSKEQNASDTQDISYHDETKHISLIGHFQYFADAHNFTPCGTSENMPVTSDDGEIMINLESAYSNTVEEAGAKVFMEVLGEYGLRPGMEGDSLKTLVIEKLIELNAYRDCP